jgi:DNA transposition AAA+ family ATPase
VGKTTAEKNTCNVQEKTIISSSDKSFSAKDHYQVNCNRASATVAL